MKLFHVLARRGKWVSVPATKRTKVMRGPLCWERFERSGIDTPEQVREHLAGIKRVLEVRDVIGPVARQWDVALTVRVAKNQTEIDEATEEGEEPPAPVWEERDGGRQRFAHVGFDDAKSVRERFAKMAHVVEVTSVTEFVPAFPLVEDIALPVGSAAGDQEKTDPAAAAAEGVVATAKARRAKQK